MPLRGIVCKANYIWLVIPFQVQANLLKKMISLITLLNSANWNLYYKCVY